MQTDCVELQAGRRADEAAQGLRALRPRVGAGGRRDGKLIGRVTVNEVVDYIREEAEQRATGAGRSARGGRHLRPGLGFGEEPLGLAGRQSGDGLSSPRA
jgi:hypothetical protein